VSQTRTGELLAGIAAMVCAALALGVPVALMIWARPTTGWLWACLLLLLPALLLTAWQWTRGSFVALTLIAIFLLVDLLVGVGKQTDLQTRQTSLIRASAYLQTQLAILSHEPTPFDDVALWQKGLASAEDACTQAGGVSGQTPQPPVTRGRLNPQKAVAAPTCTEDPWASRPTVEQTRVTALALVQAEHDVIVAASAIGGTKTLPSEGQALIRSAVSPAAPDVFALTSAGAGRMVDSVVGNRPPPTTLTLEGWLVLAVVVLLVFRWLLIVNSWNGWGPVEVHLDDEDDAKLAPDDLRRLVTIRSYLTANVPEPAAPPGSDALTQVNDMASAAAFGGAPWVKAVATFVVWALAPPSGHIVRFSYRDGTTDAATGKALDHPRPCIVTVRVSTRGRSRVLATETLSKPSESEVLRATGYWAAGWIISHATFVPEWTKWSADAGPPLGDYRTALEDDARTTGSTENAAAIAGLEAARVAAPASALVLTRLAEAYQKEDRFADALELNLLAASICPAYPVARYRAAGVFSAMAHDGAEAWRQARQRADGAIDRIARLADRVQSATWEDMTLPSLEPSASEDVAVLCARSRDLFQGAADEYLRRNMVWRALRRSERRFWLARLVDANHIRDLYLSAIPVVDELELSTRPPAQSATPAGVHPPELRAWLGVADGRAAWAGLVYNVACGLAVRSTLANATPDEVRELRDQALALLEDAPTHKGGEQISADWLLVDPDLQSLRDDPVANRRFQRLIRSLQPQPVAAPPRRR
jgi:tetratricopeptide (TPR) repeat protein